MIPPERKNGKEFGLLVFFIFIFIYFPSCSTDMGHNLGMAPSAKASHLEGQSLRSQLCLAVLKGAKI